MSNEKNRVFPPLTPQDKADTTTKIVRRLAEEDRSARETKTSKLRALRLARDAEAASITSMAAKSKR